MVDILHGAPLADVENPPLLHFGFLLPFFTRISDNDLVPIQSAAVKTVVGRQAIASGLSP